MLEYEEKVERIFFQTDKGHKKYIKRLSAYTELLMKMGRVSEASYYFDLLYSAKSDNKETNALGFKLAIRRFDVDAIRKFDKYLVGKKYEPQSLFLLRLEYYYTASDFDNFVSVAQYLLNKYTLKEDDLNTIIECVINMKARSVIPGLYSYFRRKKIKPSPALESVCKKMIIEVLTGVLKVVKK